MGVPHRLSTIKNTHNKNTNIEIIESIEMAVKFYSNYYCWTHHNIYKFVLASLLLGDILQSKCYRNFSIQYCNDN